MEYVRIGPNYYKLVEKPLPDGGQIKELVKWSKSEIITDFGKDYLKEIDKYDGFSNYPSHTNYKQSIGSFYNGYHKLEIKMIPGDYNNIDRFLKHIFGNQYELGLDYLTILWRYPKQILPILSLVSDSRNTGKSTFLNFLKLIFQNNLTINTNEDFRGRFNSDWVYKLLICVDEVLLEKREDSERLKHLSTAKSYKFESKGVDKIEVPFFGKFILCTNNEDSFVYLDDEEIRYWVIKVPTFKYEDPHLLDKLKKETPHFIHFLNEREITTKQKTRMWFSPEELHTDALNKLKKGNQIVLVRELCELLINEFEKFEIDELKYTASDLVNKLKDANYRTTSSKVSYYLQRKFKLESHNSSYHKYYSSINPINSEPVIEKSLHKGRYYIFKKNDILKFTQK
jgi:hypothetical protein